MAKRKTRILWCGEASFLNTGYAIYAKEVLQRLHQTGKYEIAELACYAQNDSSEIDSVPWHVYPNMPNNEQERSMYLSDGRNQFGAWKFEHVCLDFLPDVVIDIRDWWMCEYQERSPFRRFYHWAIMPTVDSQPQQEQYINTYMNADSVFTYSEFGKEVLEKDSNNYIKVKDITPPAADYSILKPSENRAEHRSKFGFLDNVKIIGTVMRNQRRKLYPNLMESFKKLIESDKAIAENTFLYLHTSYPDIGWDIPYLLKKYNIGKNTLFTYKCQNCNSFFPSFYSGFKTACQNCSGLAVLPSTNFGLTTKELSDVMNFFDLYVQYSICEGFGMPQVEAAACGIPVLTVRYSAMESVGKNIGADFIDVKSMFWDCNTQSQRAIPDDEQLTEKMRSFISMPKAMRAKKGMDTYARTITEYDWDKTAKKWDKHLMSVEIDESMETTWLSPPTIIDKNKDIPKGLDNNALVNYLIKNFMPNFRDNNSYIYCRLLRDLNYGQKSDASNDLNYNDNSQFSEQSPVRPFNQEDAVQTVLSIVDQNNMWEEERSSLAERFN